MNTSHLPDLPGQQQGKAGWWLRKNVLPTAAGLCLGGSLGAVGMLAWLHVHDLRGHLYMVDIRLDALNRRVGWLEQRLPNSDFDIQWRELPHGYWALVVKDHDGSEEIVKLRRRE